MARCVGVPRSAFTGSNGELSDFHHDPKHHSRCGNDRSFFISHSAFLPNSAVPCKRFYWHCHFTHVGWCHFAGCRVSRRRFILYSHPRCSVVDGHCISGCRFRASCRSTYCSNRFPHRGPCANDTSSHYHFISSSTNHYSCNRQAGQHARHHCSNSYCLHSRCSSDVSSGAISATKCQHSRTACSQRPNRFINRTSEPRAHVATHRDGHEVVMENSPSTNSSLY